MLLRCTACHGLRRQEGDLDLRTKASMLKGGKSGPAIVPGNPDESLILKMIHTGKMPPRERLVEVGVKPMTELEIERLAKWIELGAPEVQVTPDATTARAGSAPGWPGRGSKVELSMDALTKLASPRLRTASALPTGMPPFFTS